MWPGRPWRFGVTLLQAGERAPWERACSRAEALGYDVVSVPDHLGLSAPWPALMAAAAVTERVRLGTFVLNAAFYNPTVLARDVAAVDQFTGGRLELGVGTGYVQGEFTTAGLAYGSGGERVEHLAGTVARVRELLADPDHRPVAVQQPVPVLLGGNGDRMLRLAARAADIVGFTGSLSDAVGRLSLIGASTLEQRVEFARAAAGPRAGTIEWNILVQRVELTDDARATEAATRQVQQQWAPQLSVEEFAAVPTVLVGTVEQVAEQVLTQRRRYGFTYWTVLEPAMEPFAEVMAHLRAL